MRSTRTGTIKIAILLARSYQKYFSSRLLFCARTGTIKIAILLARSYQNYFVSMEAKYIDMELRIGDRDPCSLFKNKLYFILFYLITLEGSSGHDI